MISTCSDQIQVNNVPYCGDGTPQTPNDSGFNEQCDDGNTDDFDGCTNACTIPYCGDNIVLPQTTCIDVRTRTAGDTEFMSQDWTVDRRSYTRSYYSISNTSTAIATNMSLGNIVT